MEPGNIEPVDNNIRLSASVRVWSEDIIACREAVVIRTAVLHQHKPDAARRLAMGWEDSSVVREHRRSFVLPRLQ